MANTEVQPEKDFGTRPAVTHRAIDRTCPRCGHLHQGEKECGEQIGGGRICRCELDVPA
jgi:hypothetical protein